MEEFGFVTGTLKKRCFDKSNLKQERLSNPEFQKKTRGRILVTCILLACCLFLFLGCHSKSSAMETRSTIKGILQDESGKPINDAIVMIVEGPDDFQDMASVSNAGGEFKLPNVVVPGKYVLQIQNNGQQKTKQVNVQNKDTVLNITF